MSVVTFQTDGPTERALAELTADGSNVTDAIRQALVDAVRVRRREQVRRESLKAVARALPDKLHGLRFHDLRHTFAALLVAAILPPKAIQDHLGLSDFKITMNVYGHLHAEAAQAVTAALSRAFA